ncbi:DUF5336 domain-containing protein [Leucobacter japonicus]|uniref:DUF5336 domain-containing protein n=1 Tax=Leucobacter japonicus TaxID=1461259 RepID=UPI0006A7582B|nr:DUF5336 domain-containing protein [Leucobacter japonicus]
MSSFEPQQPIQQPASPQQPQGTPPPQYAAQQQYAPQQQHSAQRPQQYAPQQQFATHQQFPSQYAAPTPQPRGAASAGKLNVPGIIALAVLALSSLMSLFLPLLMRIGMEFDSYTFASTISWIVNGSTIVIAGVLAIIGLVSKTMTRWRWTAIGAAVSAALGALSFVFSLFSGFLAAAF